jgi:hypothetical protein
MTYLKSSKSAVSTRPLALVATYASGPKASIDVARIRELKAQGLGATAIAKAPSIHRASVCRVLEDVSA